MRLWRLYCWGPPMTDPECLQHMRKKLYSWGDEPEPQKAQEVTTSSPECPEIPEPKEQTEQSDAPSPPAPSSMVSNSHRDQSRNTRKAQSRARPRCLSTPDPNNANDWVQVNMEERRELPSWWQEFHSCCHKGTKPLSEAKVQELVGKLAAAFRLTATKEKSGWSSAPSSLDSLRCGDFLAPSPTRIHGPTVQGHLSGEV